MHTHNATHTHAGQYPYEYPAYPGPYPHNGYPSNFVYKDRVGLDIGDGNRDGVFEVCMRAGFWCWRVNVYIAEYFDVCPPISTVGMRLYFRDRIS